MCEIKHISTRLCEVKNKAIIKEWFEFEDSRLLLNFKIMQIFTKLRGGGETVTETNRCMIILAETRPDSSRLQLSVLRNPEICLISVTSKGILRFALLSN